MVKIVKSTPSFPYGVAGIKLNFPEWNTAPNVNNDQLKGLYRGDFLYFSYNSKSEKKDKNINNNPLIIFEGIDGKGNIVGVNLMFLNQFIDPKSSKKEVNTRMIDPILDKMRSIHWDNIYETGIRRSYMPFIRTNLGNIFGDSLGSNLKRFWRTYKLNKINNVSNITVDMAFEILSTTNPTFIRSTKGIK